MSNSLTPQTTLESFEIGNSGRFLRLVEQTLTDESKVFNIEIDRKPSDLDPIVNTDHIDLKSANDYYQYLTKTSAVFQGEIGRFLRAGEIVIAAPYNTDHKRRLEITTLDLIDNQVEVAVTILFNDESDALDDHPTPVRNIYLIGGIGYSTGPKIAFISSDKNRGNYMDDYILINAHLDRIKQALEVAKANNELTAVK